MTLALEQPIVQKSAPQQTNITHISSPDSSPLSQHIVVMGEWGHFELIQQGFEHSKARLSYYDGRIEIIMPGRFHELFRSVIGMLIEAYLFDREINFIPTGSMTQKVEKIASAEADESYEIGEFKLSIEVRVTSGSILKLRTYRALGVHEVWFWEDGVLAIYHLKNDEYVKYDSSQIPELSGIDIAILNQCILMGETDLIAARKMFRSAHPVA